MIASLRGLLALGVVTLALALGVVLDRGGRPGVVDRALVPGLARARVTALGWDRPGAAAVRLVRDGTGAGARWAWASPRVPADAAAITDVLDTLEAARWHRRGPASAAGKITATLHVRDARGDHAIGIAQRLAGADQVWLVTGGRAVLVDAWVARALDPAPLALRMRHPLAAAADARALAITGGPTLALDERLRRRADGVWVAPKLARGLADRLAQLTYVKLPAGPLEPGSGVSIAITAGTGTGTAAAAAAATATATATANATANATATATGTRATAMVVTAHGACPGDASLVALSGPDGDGCVSAADWRAALAAAAALAGPAAEVADRRPIPFAARTLAYADGTVALGTHPKITLAPGGARAVDPAQLAALAAACAAEATWASPPPRAAAPLHHLTARGPSGEAAALDLYAGDLARRDDGAWLRLPHDTWALLAGPAAAFVDPTRWAEDATAITELVLDGVRLTRGAVVGEWRGAKAPAAVEALAQTLAELRAPAAALPAGFRAIHVIEVAFAPPVGTPSRHRIELGAPHQDGCAARIDGQPARAPLALCTTAAAAR